MFQIEKTLAEVGDQTPPTGVASGKGTFVKRCTARDHCSCSCSWCYCRLFYGEVRQRLISVAESRKTKSSSHEKEHCFSHLPVNVSEESCDLYDGLTRYFDDVVEFASKTAKMKVSLVGLPPILQAQPQVCSLAQCRCYICSPFDP